MRDLIEALEEAKRRRVSPEAKERMRQQRADNKAKWAAVAARRAKKEKAERDLGDDWKFAAVNRRYDSRNGRQGYSVIGRYATEKEAKAAAQEYFDEHKRSGLADYPQQFYIHERGTPKMDLKPAGVEGKKVVQWR